LFCWFDVGGGWGRANGLGGPEAPALRRAEAEGDGGGRTTPEEWWESERLRLLGVKVDAVAVAAAPPLPEFWLVPAGEVSSAVPDSASEASEGICTLRRGRAPADFMDEFVLVRDGGIIPSEDIVLERPGGADERTIGGWCCGRVFNSGETSALISERGGSGDRPKK